MHSRELTDDETDFILEGFDKTEPKLQRRIIATTILQHADMAQLVERIREECKHVTDVSKIAELIDQSRS